MSGNPIRVATAVLSERIFAGRPTKDGRRFKEPRYDVTSDVLLAIRDKVGIGNVVDVSPEGGAVEFRIAVLPADAPEAAASEIEQLRAGHAELVEALGAICACYPKNSNAHRIASGALRKLPSAEPAASAPSSTPS